MKVILVNPTRPVANRIADLDCGDYFYTIEPKSLFLKGYGVIVELLTGKTHTMGKFADTPITPVTIEDIRVRRTA